MFMCHAAELETRTDGDALWAASRSVFADAGLEHVIYLVSDDARRRVLSSVGSLSFRSEDYAAAARSFQGAVDLMDARSKVALNTSISLGYSLGRSGEPTATTVA